MNFPLRYTGNELRRRRGRTILTALGLAAGVALLIALIGVSQGLSRAQNKVLSPLSSVGSDILVTRVAGATSSTPGVTPSPTPSPTPGDDQGNGGFGGGGGGFFGGGGGGNSALNRADINALVQNNSSIVTDLSKLGKPGTKFTHDFFLPATLITFPQQAVTQVSQLPGVSSAVGGLSLVATHQTGTVPQIVATFQTGGQTLNQTVTPPPLTSAQRAQIQACIASRVAAGGGSGGGGTTAHPTPAPSGGGGGRDGNRGNFSSCFPNGQSFRTQFRTPTQTLRQLLNPPQTDIKSTTYTAAGVDPTHPNQGVVTTAQLVSGHFLTPGATDDVLLNVAYSNTNNYKVGSTLSIDGASYHVVGLVNPTLSGETADVYYPLATMQKLSSETARVNMVLVSANGAADVDTVAKEIQKALPGAQVVTTKALADQVTGSLSSAKKAADRFGGALAIIVLAAAFIIAVLLTLSAVAKRVREIGTLRAIGWSKLRVVRQLLLETTGISLLGAAVGIGLGVLAAVIVGQVSPTLTSSQPTVPGQTSSSLSSIIPGLQSTASTATNVHLTVPLHPTTLLIGLGVALLGGLLAGAVGGWRASRMAPAEALRDLG
jgi:putative ABC transport system permease protein